MIRKITLIFLLCLGLQNVVNAQVVRDSVTISLPPYMDTTCYGTQLTFAARPSSDTFSGVIYHWYANGAYTGVSIDTFITTALSDGDSVFCWIVFHNSLGLLDSFRSNVIYIHHLASFPPGAAISLIVGSNPDCAGHPLTFICYPINGGTNPLFQWLINGIPILGADSSTFTHIYGDADTVSCQVISNSTCSAPFNDTVMSNRVPIVHFHLLPVISIVATRNPICAGAIDTFNATVADAGVGYTLNWYVNGAIIPTALGPTYITDSLHDASLVYCIVNTPDACVIGDSTVSNVITMTVIPNLPDTAWMIMTAGNNPGCLSSRVTFTGHYVDFGLAPIFTWYINSIPVLTGSTVLDTFFQDRDTVTFRVTPTGDGCYSHDSVNATPVLMVRDSIPVAPLVSLIGDVLVANTTGVYTWYGNTSYSYTGPDLIVIPGAITQVMHPPYPYPYYYFARKDTLDCFSSPSNIIFISLLEINKIKTPEVKLYPNPTTGVLNMEWGSLVSNMKIDVCSMIGQTLIHEEVNGEARHETDMSALPNGNYFVVFRGEDGNKVTYKIVIAK